MEISAKMPPGPICPSPFDDPAVTRRRSVVSSGYSGFLLAVAEALNPNKPNHAPALLCERTSHLSVVHMDLAQL